MKTKTYFTTLSGLRFICAFAVVLHHTLYYFNPNSPLLTLQLGNGSVTLFFVLSGFVLYYNYGSENSLDLYSYYKSRFIRLYPLYWFSLLLFFIFIGMPHFWMSNPSIIQILSAVFGIQSFIPYPRYYFAINPVGWFISAEILLCILFPLLAKKLDANKNELSTLKCNLGGG